MAEEAGEGLIGKRVSGGRLHITLNSLTKDPTGFLWTG
jgi:hypothetical protein